MKIHLLKSLSVLLVACLCLGMMSCQNDTKDEPLQYGASHVVGLWNVTKDYAGTVYENQCFRFRADGTFEHFFTQYSNPKYYYRRAKGTYTVENKWIEMTIKEKHSFCPIDGIVRYTSLFKNNEAYWESFRVFIDTISDGKVCVKIDSEPRFLQPTNSLPSFVKSEYAEDEQTPTAENLAGQWDYVDYFTLSYPTSSWTSWEEPSQQGMTLSEDGGMGPCRFWINDVWDLENRAYRVTSEENIRVLYADCSWSLSGNNLTMTCAAYKREKYDSSENLEYSIPYTPETPIEQTYEIYTYTGNWLILHSTRKGYYDVFRRNTSSAKVPKRSSGDGNCQNDRKINEARILYLHN